MAAGTIGWFHPATRSELLAKSHRSADDHCSMVEQYHEQMGVDIEGLTHCQDIVRAAVLAGWARINYYGGEMFIQARSESNARIAARFYREELPYEYISVDTPKISFTVQPHEIRAWLKGKQASALASRSNPIYDVPRRVRETAENALAMRAWRAQTTKRPGGTAVGVARARQLAAGSIDEYGLKRMKAFFDRFQYLKEHPNWGSPMMPGFVAWQLWGGDAGYAWAKRMLKSR